jgi:hypothetical protein
MKLPYEDFDLSGVVSYPLASRPSKVGIADLGRPYRKGDGIAGWLDTLPSLLAAADFKAVVAAICEARARERPIIWGIGAHVIKVGLSPILIDLMARGFVSALAMNGAGIIHDFEMALAGMTSEDVEAQLGSGLFGMAEETGEQLNRAINEGVARGRGLGQSVVEFLRDEAPPHGTLSLLVQAAVHDVPVTVHVAVGSDIIHMHPTASGSAVGEGSLRDFRFLTSSVAQLAGGVYLNCGSAVILPEVFLKAVALARNRGVSLAGLTTVNLDFLRLYRPEMNVVHRPTVGVGKGYSLTGHHEIMIPLLAAALVERADR